MDAGYPGLLQSPRTSDAATAPVRARSARRPSPVHQTLSRRCTPGGSRLPRHGTRVTCWPMRRSSWARTLFLEVSPKELNKGPAGKTTLGRGLADKGHVGKLTIARAIDRWVPLITGDRKVPSSVAATSMTGAPW